MVFQNGVQSIGNCLIRLDPKSCNLTFSKNLKNSIGGEFKEKTEKKNVGFLFYFLSMKKAVTSKLLMRLAWNLKY